MKQPDQWALDYIHQELCRLIQTAQQALLTDDEINDICERPAYNTTMRAENDRALARATEQALLSKLRASIADESPMAKMADALREKARQEQQAYQDRRNQATEWGPIPEGTEADSAPVADERTAFAAIAKRRAAEIAAMNIADGHGRFLNAQGHQQAISALDFCVAQFSALPGSLAGGNWRDEFSRRVYEDLAAADNQDVPLEEYPARILGVLDALASAPVADDWTPTSANINALPDRVRAYIHDLEANADPSGMVAENTLLRDQTKQLDAMIGRLKRERASAPVAMIDTAKLAQLLDSVNGDCYLGKEKEEDLVQSLRSQLRARVAEPEWIDDPHDIEQGMMRNPKYVAPGHKPVDTSSGHSAPVAGEAQQPVAVVRDNPEDYGTVIDALVALPVGTQLFAAPQASTVAREAQESIEQMAVNRYRPVPDGKFSYKVVAGDGSRSLYTGTKDSCLRVAAKLTEAFLDGAFVASYAAPQASEAVRPCTCQPDWGAKK